MSSPDRGTLRLFEAVGLPDFDDKVAPDGFVQVRLCAAPMFATPVLLAFKDQGGEGGATIDFRGFADIYALAGFGALAKVDEPLTHFDFLSDSGRVPTSSLEAFRRTFAETWRAGFRDVPIQGCGGMPVLVVARIAGEGERGFRAWAPGLDRAEMQRRFITAFLDTAQETLTAECVVKALKSVSVHIP